MDTYYCIICNAIQKVGIQITYPPNTMQGTTARRDNDVHAYAYIFLGKLFYSCFIGEEGLLQ